MLANHNCAEAFWVGNLKNRDLQVSPRYSVHCCTNLHSLPSLLFLPPLSPPPCTQGQEILSQASQLQQQSSETDNENQEVRQAGHKWVKKKGASCHFASLWNQSSQAFAIATSSNARGSECLGTWLSSL